MLSLLTVIRASRAQPARAIRVSCIISKTAIRSSMGFAFKALLVLSCALLVGCSKASMEAKEVKPIPSFSKAPYVHPRIIKDFVGWVSDRGVIIQSVDLLNAQNSNRYFGDIETREEGETLWVSSRKDGERISYALQAELGDGKYVLNVLDGSSGTYVGKHELLVQFSEETISGEKRIVLKYLGETN